MTRKSAIEMMMDAAVQNSAIQADDGTIEGVEKSLEERLEEAANLLLSQYPSHIRGFAEEVADIVWKIPRWQLVLGSVLAQYEGGCLAAPSLDPAWQTSITDIGQRVCKVCGLTFDPFKPFQETCSNECGTALLQQRKKESNAKTH